MSYRYIEQPIREMSAAIRRKEVSPVEVVRAYIERIAYTEPLLNAYITTAAEQAMREAGEAEAAIMKGEYKGKLHGVPYSVKDIYDTQGIRTTMGSSIFADHVPTEDATAVAKLKKAGAILLGKNNTHEFAMGGTNENPHFGPARNPWNRDFVPGGSSGGSGVSVAAMSSAFSLGTDTGGSIRIPAATCGVVGLKPTYGRVSRKGIFINSYNLDHAGPLSKTVWDAAAVMEAIAGFDVGDETTVNATVPPYTSYLDQLDGQDQPLSGRKIGVCEKFFFEDLDVEFERHVRTALEVLVRLGAELIPVDIPWIEETPMIKTVLSNPQCAANHEELMAKYADQYGKDVYERLQNGRHIPAWAYVDAERARNQLCAAFRDVFTQVDVLAGPTMGIPPYAIGKDLVTVNGKSVERKQLQLYRAKTAVTNLTGSPSISIPCGFTTAGFPVGLQLIGEAFAEKKVLETAYAFEQHTDHHKRIPTLGNPLEEVKSHV